ncbi:MAG: glycoside hydrolase family protein [Planctomycetota bacterium]
MTSRNSGLCTILTFLVIGLLFVNVSICSAGQTWNKYSGNPVLSMGPVGSWDSDAIGDPAVIKDGSVYRMWYWGTDGAIDGIGYATSNDGINWTKQGTGPVLSPGAPGDWDDDGVGEVSVINDGGTFKMWYSGYDGTNGRVGYATSSDGMIWTKHPDPVMDIGLPGSFDDVSATELSVHKDGSIYKMWYTGNDSGPIGYATSSDGISWTKHPSPVLVIGSPGSWDDQEVDNPSVIDDGGTFIMWYGGRCVSGEGIGYATSLDGLSWNKYSGNPVLVPGLPGSWDQFGLDCPSVIRDGFLYKMWYDGDGQGIGYAYAVIPVIEPLVGWIFLPPDVPDIGYSLEEGDLLYFYSSEPVLNYNITTGEWDTVGPNGWVYANWPFIYELDSGHFWFALPPVSGLWVYHFSTGQWTVSPRIIP